jgi:MFS family permease
MTASAIEMEVLILGWYVLVTTGSVFLLTMLGGIQYIGTTVAPIAGMIGDRFGLRRTLVAMRLVYFSLATLLAVLAVTGNLTPIVAILVAGTASLARSSDIGMRSALSAEIVPGDQLMRAIGISRTTSDAARAGGALTGASLFGLLGLAPAYAVVACCHLAGCLLTLGAKRNPDQLGPSVTPRLGPRASPWRDVRDGLAYVWKTPHLNGAIWLACLANLTTLPLTSGLMPYVAREVYKLDQTGLGILVAAYAIGALSGSLVVSFVGARIRAGTTMLWAAIVWHLVVLAFPFAPSMHAGMALLLCAGALQSLCMVPLAGMLLRTSDPELRGRVMGVRMLAINSLPFGLLIAGLLIPEIGFQATIAGYALVGLALVVAIMIGWRKSLLARDAVANRR